MPLVNGNHYRSFGQGYRAEKEKGSMKSEPSSPAEGDMAEGGSGSVMHVKHMGGGKFKTISEHHDGSKTQEEHDSPEELHAHMDGHFGTEGGEDAYEGKENPHGGEDDLAEGDEDALGSILG